MKPFDLLRAALVIAGRYPMQKTQLIKDEIGNLAIVVEGRYLGYVDLTTGIVELTDNDD